MIVHDPIYGRFRLSDSVRQLLLTPEVRRLSQIRLLNTLTPTLATLGDLRRYSHTLGVSYLAQINQQPGYKPEEKAAFAASVVLHDIGTPPFGHLFEYHLREATGWNHEDVIHSVLWGFHAPENRAHQIFGGRTLGVQNVVKRTRLSLDLIQAIITRKHPLSSLLFGSLDLDNLDNVVRMAWALGLDVSASLAPDLARALSASRDGALMLSQSRFRGAVEQWALLRRKVYEILVFDVQTVASQAALSEAIEIALKAQFLSENDWSLYDELLIEKLRSHEKTKRLISRDYLGEPPRLIYALQLRGGLSDHRFANRGEAKILVDELLTSQFGKGKTLSYAFVDRGSFEKQLDFKDPDQGGWQVGVTSKSLILYAFSRVGQVPLAQATDAVKALKGKIGTLEEVVIKCVLPTGREEDEIGDEPQLTLPAF